MAERGQLPEFIDGRRGLLFSVFVFDGEEEEDEDREWPETMKLPEMG